MWAKNSSASSTGISSTSAMVLPLKRMSSVAAADRAAAALDVEAEAARLVTAGAGLLRAAEEVADHVEQPRVGGRVRARRATDRRLVDLDDLVELLEPADLLMLSRALSRAVQPVRHGLVQHAVD